MHSRQGKNNANKARRACFEAGKYDLSKNNERGSLNAYPLEIKIHSDWKYFTEKYEADIALILLENKIQFSPSIYPICLWNKNNPEPSTKEGVIVGWGKRIPRAITKIFRGS